MSSTKDFWFEMGTINARDTDQLIAIEQKDFGIVCAVFDREGSSVARILEAVNAREDMLKTLKAVQAYLIEQRDGGLTSMSRDTVISKVSAAIAKATGQQ